MADLLRYPSEVREQRSEGRRERSGGREQKGDWVVDDAAEHFADFLAQAGEFAVLLGGDVAAVAGEVER